VSHTIDGSHERGDKHGADDHRCGVHVQSHGGHHDGKHQNPEVGTLEDDTSFDVLMDSIVTLHLTAEVEPFQQLFNLLPHNSQCFGKTTKKNKTTLLMGTISLQ